ncbi:MAG: hypothetical protein A2504_09580 [Bdellovibrionales bacterium RIFOXYD12_FULL_39_22]|nr:MAG: hypothetical protein A2385_13070 [Bdellovibrionales bacterium RIFOXYB1_FULL_39_21]OFZ40977.1 MAG: hypothetical protein A2485_16580 [Bdellovibrionales bacterium RIFOXYC12_FULL_39_17]OFZ44805.1 MAG: hypothetical protein A2404_09870 [Bdellovibrionales bacterium RIFOXYC1_FULL_39_130]OFZ69348.1 MAG: hypothetical protein A2451_01010 [Bdellovibrionales bacterium RIFOXYC2_FULL_39_8]OFZ74270.1 MAG: hypothetical protein A2560_16835 [Bdellovibrionales bacterium RIFOXYD1_FULL_39_84]OFZ92134.1 MAG:
MMANNSPLNYSFDNKHIGEIIDHSKKKFFYLFKITFSTHKTLYLQTRSKIAQKRLIMSTIDDITIMNGIKAGNSKDVEMLFDKYSQSLLRHIHRITFNKEISEDILNETFMTIIQKINFYKDLTEEGQTFKAWIFRIATNEAIDVIRKEKREKIKRESLIATTSTPEHCSTEEQLQSVQNQGVIHSLMMELPTIQRIVINLKIKEDMSYLEISRVCGYSIESVKQALFKARLNLQKKLDLSEGAI